MKLGAAQWIQYQHLIPHSLSSHHFFIITFILSLPSHRLRSATMSDKPTSQSAFLQTFYSLAFPKVVLALIWLLVFCANISSHIHYQHRFHLFIHNVRVRDSQHCRRSLGAQGLPRRHMAPRVLRRHALRQDLRVSIAFPYVPRPLTPSPSAPLLPKKEPSASSRERIL